MMNKPTEFSLGRGIFNFSDRYSVFDWGKMQDEIPYKGAAICIMAAWNFEQLHRKEIKTHYMGVLDNSGRRVNTRDLIEPSNKMAIWVSRVIKPDFKDGKYNYEFFSDKGEVKNFVVPLEVIYRNGVPEGSSLLKKFERLKEEGRNEELQKTLTKYGLTQIPKSGDLFPQTGYDFTTKFESSDRGLTDEEAYEISGLTKEQFKELENNRNKVVSFLKSRSKKVGLDDYDGKLEFMLFDGIRVADVFGTPDENRFVINGQQISKEIARQYYKKQQPEWCEDIERAKNEAIERGMADWKSLTTIKPKPLPAKLRDLIGEMYASVSDKYTELNLFKVRPLEKIMGDLKQLQNG